MGRCCFELHDMKCSEEAIPGSLYCEKHTRDVAEVREFLNNQPIEERLRKVVAELGREMAEKAPFIWEKRRMVVIPPRKPITVAEATARGKAQVKAANKKAGFLNKCFFFFHSWESEFMPIEESAFGAIGYQVKRCKKCGRVKHD